MTRMLLGRILLVSIVLHCAQIHEVAAKFYQGCSDSVGFNNEYSVEQRQLPFSCIRICIKERFSYAAIQNGSRCYCLLSVQSWTNSSNCAIRCPSNDTLHCGSIGFKSVFTTALPVISAVIMPFKSKSITSNMTLALEVVVVSIRTNNETQNLQSIQGMNKSLDKLYFTWKLNDVAWNYSDYLLVGNTTKVHKPILLHKSGLYKICVKAENLVSEVTKCGLLDVLLPIAGVRLIDIQPRRKLLVKNQNKTLLKEGEQIYIKVALDKGSKVDFTASFGNGTSPFYMSSKTSDPYNSLGLMCVTIWHDYHSDSSCGNHIIQVNTTNAISNVSLPPIPVEIEEHIRYAIIESVTARPGELVKLQVKIENSQCKKKYNWTLGTRDNVLTTEVPHIEYRFNETKKYSIFVNVFNDVSNKTAEGSVYIQTPLSNVTLTVKGSPKSSKYIIEKINKHVVFGVTIVPNFDLVKYVWSFNGKKTITYEPSLERAFSKPASLSVYVVAKNKINNVTSNVVHIIIEEPINKVELDHKGVIKSKQNITFTAIVNNKNESNKAQNNYKLLWDFGDGNTLKTTITQVIHRYKKIGLYNVRVMAYNNVSRLNDSTTIYVTKMPSCQPPNIKIAGWHYIKMFRYQAVNVESQVKLDCMWADMSLIYEWKVVPISNEALKPNTSLVKSSEADLTIPPYTLSYGIFDVILKVGINKTILSSQRKIQITVIKHGLVANIKGGTMRVVGYKSEQLIVLDGRDSTDPDFPTENNKLKFKWECHLLNDNTTSCFDSKVKTSLQLIEMPASQLLSGKDALLITLTVSKGEFTKSTWQILRMVNARPHLLAVRCPQCEESTVNYNDALILQGDCSTCPWNTNNNLTFQWELYLVSENPQLIPDKCIPGSVHQQALHVDQSTKSPKLTTIKPNTIKPTIKPSIKFSALTGMMPVHTHTMSPTHPPTPRPVVPKGRIDKGSVCEVPLVRPTLFPTICRKVTRRLPLKNLRFASFYVCSTVQPTTDYRGGTSGHGSAFPGKGSGTISYPYRPSSGSPASPIVGTIQPTMPGPTPTKSYDSVYDPKYVVPAASYRHHLLTIKRSLFDMPASWTKTGLNNRNLVLNKGKLVSGQLYMLALKVSGMDQMDAEQRRGMANVFFKVNNNPDFGSCSVMPGAGLEIKTQFRIKCVMQHSVNNDISWYRFTYKIEGDNDKEFLIYTGRSSEPTFTLPAGLQKHAYNVILFISAFNKKGTAVEVCPLTLRVKPTAIRNIMITAEEYILNKTNAYYMKNLIKIGEQQQVKQLVKVLAKALNRLAPVKNTSSRFYLRKEARLGLLNIVNQLRVFDMTSAVQTAEALYAITKAASELNFEGLEIVSQLLLKAESEIVRGVSRKPSGLNTNLVNLVTEVVSNVLSSSQLLRRSNSTKYKRIQLRIVTVIQDIIKNKLKMFVLGEKDYKVTHPMMSAIISQSLLISRSRWTLQNVTFSLPSAMENHLGIHHQTYSTACVGTTVIVYEENPFAWNEPNKLFETKASSLALSSCNGEPIAIRDLKHEVEISLPWTHGKPNEPQEEFTVKWQYLNIHSIHRNNSVANQSLQLKIQTLSKLDKGLVLRVVFVMDEKEEDLEQANVFRTTDGGLITFMFTAKDLINASSVIRVGVLMEDVALNRIKKVYNATPVIYSISSKWIGCYYWNDQKEIWSTQGCFSTDKTTDTFINCRCNHLTMFVGKAFWSPNPLSFKDLRNISRLQSNPVSLALVLCLVAVYVLLMIYCHKLDMIDIQKGGEVFLASVPCRRSYRYKITVETGHWFRSGTTATVVMRMFGEVNTSDPIELVAKDKPLLERGSKDVFNFDSSIDLSPIWKIHVWHYNNGNNPSWYLNRIIVQDMASNDKWYFDSYRWLAVDEEDGKIDVELMPLGTKNNVIKRHYHHLSQYFLDYHLWLSVFGRPSNSSFNHKQRLTCCLSLILSFLCVNAAWFHTKTSGTKPFEILGLLDVTWETVIYGMLCSLIAIPVNVLWILMFRFSKPYNSSSSKIAPLPYDDPITETSCVANATEYNEDTISILDQTIETLLYLKALGRKLKPYSSYWDDKTSLDSVFENFEGESFSYGTGSELQTAVPTKAPPSPVRNDNTSSYTRRSSQVTTISAIRPQKGFSLPHYCVYIAWFGCGITVVVTAFFTVSYGLSFGRQKCIIWLQSLCFSLMESLFISQPFMVLAIPIYGMCSKCLSKSKTKVSPLSENLDKTAEGGIHSNNNSSMDISLKAALDARRRQRYLKFLKPLPKTILSDAAEKQHVKKVVYDYARDFLTSLILLVLVCLLVSGMYCRCALNIKNTVEKTILKHSSNEVLNDRGRVDLWWQANQEQIIDLLFWRPDEWALEKNQTAQIFFRGTPSVLVGRPRIRQYKTTTHKVCSNVSVPGINQTWTRQCWTRCIQEEGQWSIVDLSRTKSNAEAELKKLASTGWISMCTNHVTIEFVIYAASLDVYSVVTWEVRGPSSGLSNVEIQVNSIKDAINNTAMDIFLKICKALFVATVVFCLYNEIVCLIRIKLKYFKSFWKYIKACCLILSSISIIGYVHWSVAVYSLVRGMLSEGQDDVITAGTIVHNRQETLIALYAMIIFLLFLKVIHLLRIFKFVQRFCGLLWLSFGSLSALMVLLLLSIIMFSHFGYLLFGRYHVDFKTFSSTFIYTCALLRLRGNDHFSEDDESRCLSIIYVCSCFTMLVVVWRGLCMAILNWSVHSTKRKHLPTHLLVEFLSKLRCNMNHKKIEEESDDEAEDSEEDEIEDKQIVPVEYACDEVEFQMEELLFKMDNLVGESGLANLRLSSSSDLLLSSDECEDDVEYLYNCQEYKMQTLIPDLGSGYESDRSFYSFGSGGISQEGLTDLEIQRRISKDSSVMTTEMNTFYATGVHPCDFKEIHQREEFNDVNLMNETLQQLKGVYVSPKMLYRTKSFLSQSNEEHSNHSSEYKPDNDVLQSPSASSMENRRSSLTRTKLKQHLLTRKPKLRQGQISLDDIPKDIGPASSCSTYPEGSTSSEEDPSHNWAQTRATNAVSVSKKPSYLKKLLSKTSIAAMNDSEERLITTNGAYNTQSSQSSGSNGRHIDGGRNSAFWFEEDYQETLASSNNRRLSTDAPLSPSEPGFSNNGYYEDTVSRLSDDEMVPLPGMIGDICANANIGTNIDPTSET